MEKDYENRKVHLKERYQARKRRYEERCKATEVKAEVMAPSPVEERVEEGIEEVKERSVEEGKKEEEVIKFVLTDIKGIGPARVGKFEEAGIKTIDDLAKAAAEEVANILNVSVIKAEAWIKKAAEMSA